MTRRAFTLLELVIAMVVSLTLVYSLVQLGHHFLVGFISGEQKYGELREAGLVLDGLRGDLEAMQPDFNKDDLGLSASGTTLTFYRQLNGNPILITWEFLSAQGVVRRTAGIDAPILLGAGLVRNCAFATEGYLRAPGGALASCVPRQSAGALKRVLVALDLSVAPASGSEDPWLVFRTHICPSWTNRRLTSVWNRKK